MAWCSELTMSLSPSVLVSFRMISSNSILLCHNGRSLLWTSLIWLSIPKYSSSFLTSFDQVAMAQNSSCMLTKSVVTTRFGSI
ncbi:unnamed protein product, partial [Vitis vinifera]